MADDKTYDYEPAYPINIQPGGGDTTLTGFQKLKSEFERIYRLLNSNLAEYDIKMQSVSARVDSLLNDVTKTIADFKSDIDKKITDFTKTLDEFRASVKNDVSFSGYVPITLAGRTASGTATGDGFLVVDANNSGSDIALEVYVNNTKIGYVSGDGSYGGSDSTTTIPVKKGSRWSISGAGVTNAWWFSIGNSTCGADAVPSIPSSADSSSSSSNGDFEHGNSSH